MLNECDVSFVVEYTGTFIQDLPILLLADIVISCVCDIKLKKDVYKRVNITDAYMLQIFTSVL